VQLNAQSTLGFPAAFKRGPRRVTLSGEGFFEIARDERQPFVVETSAVVVTARATRFNLAAYAGEGGGEVSVVSGEAQLIRPNQPSPIRLSEAQSYVWADVTGAGRVEPLDEESALAWREARLVFKNTPLSGVAKKLSRKFGVPVEVAAAFSSEVKITAHFTAETLEEICATLELTGELICRAERSIGGGVMRVDFLPPAR
jgi:ferric-dicitrate binding protein FerR (iron transport regulator)